MNYSSASEPAAAKSTLPPARGIACLPTLDLRLYSLVAIGGREYRVRQKLGKEWLLIDTRTEDSRLLTDVQIANLQAEGEFVVLESGVAPSDVARPISPLVHGQAGHLSNIRKHEYVSSCLELGDEFRRSRRILLPVIEAVAQRLGEAKPGFTTVLAWIEEHERFGGSYGTAAYSDRHDLKGDRRPKMMSWQEAAMEEGVGVYLSGARITAAMAYPIAVKSVLDFDREFGSTLPKGSLGSKFVSRDGALKPPSLRTFQRRCSAVDRYTRDLAKRGERYARSNNRTYATIPLPARPYEQVEVDHGRLDIIVIDEGGTVFGRPDIIVFRDRATGMILGYSVGFEEPSYAAFVQGLKHAFYPKDVSHLAIENPWPCFGRIENLFVDNALHFIGHNIEEAGRELGFNVVKLAPRSPWLKGSLERFFGTMNKGILHSLPGTVLENALARRDYDTLGEATLTLPELDALITKWICDVYHVQLTKGLGVIRGLGDTPLNVWNQKAKTYETAPLPNKETFMTLAGDTVEHTIQRDGVVWDHIKYEDPALITILTDPRHQSRKAGKPTTKYKLVRDPYDLGAIKLINHHTGQVLTLPATDAHHQYASGLTLYQHRVIVVRAQGQAKGAVDVEQLMRTKAQLASLVVQMLNKPVRKKTQRKLARYLQRETARKLGSRVSAQDFTDSSASGFLDLLGTTSKAQAEALGPGGPSPSIANAKPRRQRTLDPASPSSDDLADLEPFRKSRNWSVSDG